MANTAPILPDTRFDIRSKLSSEPAKEDGDGEDFAAAVAVLKDQSSVPLADAVDDAGPEIGLGPDGDVPADTEALEISEDRSTDTLEAIIEGWSGVSGSLALPKSKAADAATRSAFSGPSPMIAMIAQDNAAESTPITAQIDVDVQKPQTPFSDTDFTSGLNPETMMLNADRIMDVGNPIEAIGHGKGIDQASTRGEISPSMPRLAAENQPTILRQVADAAITIRDEQVEIALSPEELGRIRMVLSGREHAPHLVVWAERPEVLDQLRRNAATLLQNFGETGLQDATFEFREGGFEGRDAQPDWMATQAPAVDVDIPKHLARHAITSGGWTALGAHIDMRM